MLRLFFPVALIFSFVSPAASEADSCGLGGKIRAFANSSDPKLLSELIENPLFARDDEKYVEALVRLKAMSKIKAFIVQTNVSGITSAARERRANALLRLLDYDKDAVTLKLYIDLAETQAARKVTPPKLSDSEWLKRIEVLSDHNDNILVISEATARKTPLNCKAQFLLGKAYRKNRSYEDARGVLDKVATSCPGNEGLNAAFLLARLAAITATKDNMKYFERFEKKYSTHSYLDDVLLFKASALETMGRKEEAKATLRKIWEMPGVADMRFEAIFRLAFMYALEGKSSETVEILRSSLKHEYTPPATNNQKQRANYWIARLSLYPEIGNLRKAKEPSPIATKMLDELASSRQPTYYSWLASELLGAQTTQKRESSPERKGKEHAVMDPNFKTILCLFSNGYENEGKRLVELMEPDDVPPDQRLNVAYRLNELGLYGDAFRFAKSVGGEDPFLMYPKAYQVDVEEASKRVGPPQHLLYGLMREESLFDARVISWAGARGVFQLMPSVALEEARKFQIKDLTEEGMLDPKINILLGAKHLKGMLDDVKHPLFAVAAYNAGLDRVKRWEERWKDYEVLDSFVENIPLPETREYVKRVAGSWVNYSFLYSSGIKPFGIKISSRS